MAAPSKISQLPQDMRDELIDRLLATDFSDYDGHHAWLQREIEERGLEIEPISRAAIARLGKRRKSMSQRVQEIRAMQLELGRDPVQTNRTTMQMLQLLAFAKTRDAYDGTIEIDEAWLKDLALTVARLEKAAQLNEDREREIRDEERSRNAESATKAVEAEAKRAGLTPQGVAAMREAIMKELTG
jgi:hypothetical protein